MRIALASDHAGLQLRSIIIEHLHDLEHEVIDHGPDSTDSVDYPDFAEKVAHSVTTNEADCGILVCGTGVGMAMAANRVAGIRAAVCESGYTVRMTRLHNNANVLCLGERVVGAGQALELVKIFLETKYEGGRHQNRLDKLKALENN